MEQDEHIILIFRHIHRLEVTMDAFFPFIHKIEKKKNDEELQPLYVELEPPPVRQEKDDKEESPRVIIIEL